MLEDPSHPAWLDGESQRQYNDLVGDMQDTLTGAMSLICDELTTIQRSLRKVEASNDTFPQELKKRIKIALQGPSFEKALSMLGQHTHHFVSLMDLCIPYQPKVDRDSTALSGRDPLRSISIVKEKASDLHEVLRNACTKHSEHQALLSLEPCCSQTTRAQVKFSIALAN